jgi:GH35 family endo-1,4-beta-xylanase
MSVPPMDPHARRNRQVVVSHTLVWQNPTWEWSFLDVHGTQQPECA